MVTRSFFTVVVTLLSFTAAFADDVPQWLRQAAATSVPVFAKDVPAVLLQDEEIVTLGTDGKLVTVENIAIKILSDEGRDYAVARAPYLVSSSKIRDFGSWMIRTDGNLKSYDKKAVIDIIADREDVYNEGRLKIIDASRDAQVGAVFGYTVVTEEVPLFFQDAWGFQTNIPTVRSRYSLNLPPGWTATSLTFNAPEVVPQVSGSSYTWEMRDLNRIPNEKLSPAMVNVAARMVVNYFPDKKDLYTDHVFNTWADVSRWATALHTPQVVVDDAVVAKARDLTANARSELDKIRAIGTYVQNLQYIAIDIGVGHGNGYRPRSSTMVLGRGYGDCKDKANLMRALLRSIKIEAYPVAIFSGDPTFVREQWASPRQFNHIIIAVRVSDETKAPTVIQHETLGRLLIFDATDPYTPVGDLPNYLQGSQALIIAGDNGGLVKMPVTPPETDRLVRDIEAKLSDAGEVSATIREHAHGQASTAYRREFRNMSAPDYRKAIEGWVTSGATGAQVQDVQTKEAENNSFDLNVAFSAQRYGQLLQNRLLVFKPVIVSRRQSTYLTEATRTNPIEMDGFSMIETVSFTLPDGFSVDELPDPVDLQAVFGTYSTKYAVTGNKLQFTRELKTNRMTLPVEKYGMAKDFFAKMREAEQAPVVLIRK